MSIFLPKRGGQPRFDGQVHSLKVTESVLATSIPIVIGTMRVHSKLLVYTDFTAKKDTTAGGKGFGGKGAKIYDYFATIQAALCQGPIGGIRSIWDQSGQLPQVASTETFTIPQAGGFYAVTNNAQFGFDHGITTAQNYSVNANDYGSPGAATISGTQQVPMVAIRTPSPVLQPNQYTVDGNGNYIFHPADAGKLASVTYSYSLYYVQATEACQVPFSAPFSFNPANQQFFHSSISVVYTNTGLPLTKVSGAPAQGQYSVDQGLVSGGTYTFSGADAGKFLYVTYNFTSSDSRFTSASKLNLTVFTGGANQQPWSYMASKHPSLSLAYPTIAHVSASQMSLGTSAVLPSYNYEVFGSVGAPGGGLLDAQVTDAINAVLTNPIWGIGYPVAQIGDWGAVQQYLTANGFYISAALNTPASAASIMGEWVKAANIGVFQSEGLLKGVPYGDTTVVGGGQIYSPKTQPVYRFIHSNGDFIHDKADDPVNITSTPLRDAKNYVQVQWTDRNNSYNVALTQEQDDNAIRLYGFRPDTTTNYDFITNPVTAVFAGQCQLNRNIYIRAQYEWTTDFRKGYIEAMDIVTLDDGMSLQGEPVRIIDREDAVDGSIKFTAEQFPWGAAQPNSYSRQTATSYQPSASLVQPGPTTPYLFETTVAELNGRTNVLKVAASGQGNNWGGCRVWASLDNATFNPVGDILAHSKIGVTTSALPAGSDPDTVNTLNIDMTISGAVVDSVTQGIADAFGSLIIVFDATGTVLELMSYETAHVTALNQYALSYLRRGVYSTTIAAHPAGARFVALDENVLQLEYRSQFVGQQIWLKFTSFNNFQGAEQLLSDVPAYAHTIAGQTLGPPGPGSSFINPANPLTAPTGGNIIVHPFTNSIGTLFANCLPGGNYTIGGLSLSTSYYVYYVDLAFAGGNITPIATTNVTAFQSKTGYYLIGTITTSAI